MSVEKVLVVDDEILMRRFLQESFERFEIAVQTVQDATRALYMLNDEQFDVVFTDIKMPNMSGIELLKRIKGQFPQTEVVVMTAYGTIETAIEAMKYGAFDYILKPFSVDQIEIVLKKIMERQALVNENRYLKQEINEKYNFDDLIAKSRPMQSILKTVKKIAATKATVLIQGPSGTGKELVARTIHYSSERREQPFIKLNCAAIPETLIESELFGHEKGAFTNAVSRRLGRFELANGGTLLLDEISEIPLHLQAKLLRVIQEREFERVGGEKSISVDVRIIATTNRDMIDAVKKGEFREDLYYRLNVVPLILTPLHHRPDDIEELAVYFVQKYCKENGIEPFAISNENMEALKEYTWPGNIRELENVVERSVVLGYKEIEVPSDQMSLNRPYSDDADYEENMDLSEQALKAGMTIREMEKMLIFETLKANCWNKTKTAQMLDISIRTLRNKLNEYRENNEIPEEYSYTLAAVC
ncbi:MAG: sigma-54 dependent transcriptional regulator [Candidatus Auribacterota bacterium]|jgi:DNA-binding NtrC family response regulator|nr:sigma-54 dependent transcriptional regulator [Candidatus Auribacterota bacterium]